MKSGKTKRRNKTRILGGGVFERVLMIKGPRRTNEDCSQNPPCKSKAHLHYSLAMRKQGDKGLQGFGFRVCYGWGFRFY